MIKLYKINPSQDTKKELVLTDHLLIQLPKWPAHYHNSNDLITIMGLLFRKASNTVVTASPSQNLAGDVE